MKEASLLSSRPCFLFAPEAGDPRGGKLLGVCEIREAGWHFLFRLSSWVPRRNIKPAVFILLLLPPSLMQTALGGNTPRCPRWAGPGHTKLVKLGVPDSTLPSLGRRPHKPVTLLKELKPVRPCLLLDTVVVGWVGGKCLAAPCLGACEAGSHCPLSPLDSRFSCFLGASLECPPGQCPGAQTSPCDCQPVLVWCWAQPSTHQHRTARGQGEATPRELGLSWATVQLYNLGTS